MTVTKVDANKTPLMLTEAAAKHIAKKIENTPNAIGFRLSVKDAGCNSKMYVPDYVSSKNDNDVEFDQHGIRVFINKDDLVFLAGTKVDYVQDGINKVLKYNNPLATSACGCGESFNIE